MDKDSKKQAEIEFTDIKKGLSTEYVSNHIHSHKKLVNQSLILAWKTLLNQVTSIFFILLLISAGLSLWLGHKVDASIFIIINIANVLLGFIQEYRASKASQTLQNLIKHSVAVIRDGLLKEVSSEDVLEGDIVCLSPGDVLVADIIVRECTDAFIDKSVLTGESLPIEAICGQILNAGCSVASGTIKAQVVSSVDRNSLTLYAEELDGIKKSNSFANFVSKISLNILFVTLISILLVGIFGVIIAQKYSLTDFILYSISMLIGVVPESLPLIITLMLTREALQLSKEKVIVKRLASLQQLGSIKFLLTDKTGTLTENNIKAVNDLDNKDIRSVALAISNAEYERTPMDQTFDMAINALYEEDSQSLKSVLYKTKSPKVTPFKSSVGYAIFSFDDQEIIRGQYTSIVAICAGINIEEKMKFDNLYSSYESQGLRVIAIASRNINNSSGITAHASVNSDFIFNGFLVFEDPLKLDAPHSYKAAEGLGITVKVLTGDSSLVALYIAKKLDKNFDERHICSLETTPIANISDKDMYEDRVYARCHPENKLELIDKHLKYGAVGFLGEGINDALALKRADVGMVVYNASDVARQSADILLMEKSLNPVIKAIQMSRRIYAHIFTYLLCTLTGNLGTLFSLTAVTLFWTELPMLPVQILLNNLLTDVPLILLITDRLSKDEYNKPVDHSAKEFFKYMISFALISSIFDLVYFAMFKDYPIETLRTGWFVFSVLCELILVLSLRTLSPVWKAPKLSMPIAVALSLCALFAITLPYLSFIAPAFSLVVLPISISNSIFILLIAYFTINEVFKYIYQRKKLGYT